MIYYVKFNPVSFSEESLGEEYNPGRMIITNHTWYKHKNNPKTVFFIHPESEKIINNNRHSPSNKLLKSYDIRLIRSSNAYKKEQSLAIEDCEKIGGRLSTMINNKHIIYVCTIKQ